MPQRISTIGLQQVVIHWAVLGSRPTQFRRPRRKDLKDSSSENMSGGDIKLFRPDRREFTDLLGVSVLPVRY